MSNVKNKSLNRRIISSSVSVVISLSLVLFVIGLLSLLLINAQRISNYLKENIGMTIMLNEGTNEIETAKFQKVIDGSYFVKSTTFVSKEEATISLERELGEDFVDFLGYSPLLASIDVKLYAEYANNDSLLVFKNEIMENSCVNDVFYQENLIHKLNSNINRISFFLISFSILLFIIAFALINNTIRLSVYSKRFLIRTMRLVGANSSFIQKPFLIKSFYQGLYGSIFAVFMLIGSIHLVQNETASILNITDLKIIGFVFILVFISGILLSWLSTYFSVRRFIKLKESELYN